MNINDVMTASEVDDVFGLGAGTTRQYLNNNQNPEARKSAGTWIVNRDFAEKTWGVEVGAIEWQPEPDPFKTGSQTSTELIFRPGDRDVSIVQAQDTRTTTFDRIFGVELYVRVDAHTDEKTLRKFVQDNQALFRRVRNGFRTDRDAQSNLIGVLTEDAQEAWSEVEAGFQSYMESYAHEHWDVESLFGGLSDEEVLSMVAGKDLQSWAAKEVADYKKDGVIVAGGDVALIGYVKSIEIDDDDDDDE